MSAPAPTRPVLRWHGGKWLLARWIIAHFPPHRCYVEPYGGAWSVGLLKPLSHREVYNDKDDRLVGLFRMLREPAQAAELIRRLELTPFARTEFYRAYEPSDDPIEDARRWLTRSWMGHGSDGGLSPYRTGFRASSSRSDTTSVAREWAGYPAALALAVERLRAVVIENRDAHDVMAANDAATTLHFVDPPYPLDTRSRTNRQPGGGTYAHELTDDDHVALLAFLKTLKGMVVLSGYPSALYDQALAGWRRVERAALADGARPRIEVLWLNPAAVARLGAGPLFRAGSPTPAQSGALGRIPV
ncbi:MAG TPA: DNA adenine methylase [Allosphingosinicella sp.]|nr:DNA adenine methylase [Allosphingosinicella sp.]